MGNVHVHSVRFCEECPFERTKNGPNDRGGRRGRSGRGDQGDRALVVGGRLITTKRDSGWGPYDHGSMVREWTMKYRLVKDPRKLAKSLDESGDFAEWRVEPPQLWETRKPPPRRVSGQDKEVPVCHLVLSPGVGGDGKPLQECRPCSCCQRQ